MSSGNAGGGRTNGGGRGGGGATAALAAGSIPAGSRKIVQNLKEIVNFPEAEIYAMLKECNMDPSEAVNRLLNQDTFQEVKSKRDKKKEAKEAPESKVRGGNSTTNRRGRAGNDRVSLVGSSNSISSDYGASRSKPLLKKENVPNAVPGPSILGSAVPGNVVSRASHSSSIPTSADAATHAVSGSDGTSFPSKPSSLQCAWSGVPGQVSMADVVRMGRSHSKISNKPAAATEVPSMVQDPVSANDFQGNTKHTTSTVLPLEPAKERQSSQDNVTKISEAIYDANPSIIDGSISHDGLVNQLCGENSSVFATSSSGAALGESSQSSNLHDDGVNLQIDPHMDGSHIASTSTNFESLATDSVRPDTSCDGQLEVPAAEVRPPMGDAAFESLHPYELKRLTFEHHEATDTELSAVATDLQHLSIQQEAHEGKRLVDHPAVIFPDHLQVTSTDCSHLSFGSFGSGGATLPGSHVQKTLSNLEQPPTSDVDSFGHVDVRSTEFYDNEQIKATSEENTSSRDSTAIENYEQSSSSQLRAADADATHPANELQYNIPPLLPSHHAFSSTTQPSATDFNYANTRPQGQDHTSISSMVQAYVNSLQSNTLSSASQPGGEFDPPYLPMLTSQPLQTKYNTVMSSISEPTISMQETLKTGFFSGPQILQPTSQSLESTSIPSGPGVPQHLPVHPYSQTALPLGHFAANMLSYPFLHPSYTYMPSAFQPTYTSSNAYNQSPTAAQSAGVKYTLTPQYKNSFSLNSLQQSAAIPSGYGNFGNSANVPGSFMLNPPSAAANATNFEDGLGSQYKESSPYASLQQGGGSRTISGLPANTYYGLQGQSQQTGFRQQQQPSQLGNLGYANFYRTHVGASQEIQQNPSEIANLSSSQGLPSQSSHHLWQRNY